MGIRKWAALAAALLLPTFLFAAAKRNKTSRNNKQVTLQNLKAFLLMIQYAEGTLGPNAYRMLYGGGLFSDYSTHPNIAVTKWGITSTAAGAYGFLYRVWVELSERMRLPDFSPRSQHRAAIEMIKGKNALADVLDGRIEAAIYKCRKIWASFPGAGYRQSEKSLELLLAFYKKAGGIMSSS